MQPLDSAYEQINGAREHLDNLRPEIDAFANSILNEVSLNYKKGIINIIEESDAVNLHGTSLEIGSITFTGVGGSNPTPFGTPFELSEEEINELLEQAIARGGQNVHNILVVHAPPYGTLDELGGANVGCRSIRAHLKEFDLVCCGHIHDHTGVMEEEGTVIVNPGPAAEGKCAVIILGEEAKDIQVDLIQL